MPNRAEDAVASIVVDPDIAIDPRNDIARDVAGVDKKDRRVAVNHFVDVTIPRAGIYQATRVDAQRSDRPLRSNVEHLEAAAVPFEQAVLSGCDPDVSLEVLEQASHWKRRVVE